MEYTYRLKAIEEEREELRNEFNDLIEKKCNLDRSLEDYYDRYVQLDEKAKYVHELIMLTYDEEIDVMFDKLEARIEKHLSRYDQV